jgi:alanine racemase
MVLLYFEYDEATIQNRMELLYPVEMRLKVKTESIIAVLSMTVIVLIFNLKNSIGFSRKSKKYKKKTVILSDIFQSGLPKDELYDKVADLIIAHKIDRVIGIGETISAFKTKFANAVTYKTQLVYN